MVRIGWSIALLAACGGAREMESAGDAPAQADASEVTADAAACVPLGACDWIDGYQRHIVGALAGAEDITPGMRLSHRASTSERDIARQFLIAELTALGYAPMRHDYTDGSYVGANVIVTLAATSGNGGVIVIGGHFDGVPAGPAAADNATGVAI